jgi:hypothetical protein
MKQTKHPKCSRPARASLLLLQAALVTWSAPASTHAQTASDPYPQTTIAFFNATTCPGGWEPYTDGNGRFVVPVSVNSGVGQPVLSPLSSGQDPTHTHDFSSAIQVKRVKYAGKSGGGNTNLAHAGRKDFTGTTVAASSNIPYIQLLICIKTATPGPGAIPSGVTSFFRDLSCPTGWSSPPATLGRFLVALPPNGAARGEFGGSPLTSQENRAHTHQFSGSVETKAHGIAGVSGCQPFLPCARDYAKHATYSYNKETESGNTKETGSGTANLPYIQLMHCTKQ